MTDRSISEQKVTLRAEMRARRAAIGRAARAAAGQGIVAPGIHCLSDLEAGSVVAGFMPIGEEISPLPLMRALLEDGHRLALPVMVGKSEPLLFRAYELGDRLATVIWGIREPLPDKIVVLPNVVLVALLAFDGQGHRLGYGGGYYDRTIRALRSVRPDTRIIGMAYDELCLDAVPVGDYDERVDWILTPSGARRTAT